MSSVVTVQVKYDDNSHSLTENFSCADTHPSATIIKELEAQMTRKWEDMGQSYRGIQIHTKVRQSA